MKKAIILIMFMFGAMFTLAQTYEDEGVINVYFVNQDPDPVEPGEYVDIRWRVENIGDVEIEDIYFEILPKYPFTPDPGENLVKTISSLGGRQKDDTGFILKYKMRVDDNALEGINTIQLRYKVGSASWTTQEYNIDVQTIDANLGIMSVETVPEVVFPGEKFELKIKVKNLADSVIKDVSIKMDMLLSTITVGAATPTTKTEILDALPFAPVKSATEKNIRNIKPGEEVIFSYSLIAYPDAEAKVYKVPIEVDFFDGIGTEYNKEDVVGIIVESKPDLSVLLDQTDIKASGSKGEITVKIVNKGLTDIKFMNVILTPVDEFELLSPKEVYIGNIDSDDYETADFEIYVKQNGDEDLKIPISYEYMDANNNKFTNDVELTLKIYSEDQAKELGVKETNMTFVYVGIVAVIIIAFLIFRAVRKRRKQK